MPDEIVPNPPVASDGGPEPVALTTLPAGFDPFQLLPEAIPENLDPAVHMRASLTQQALVVLGPAGGAVTTCPGNQVGIEAHQRCPLAPKCEMLKAMQAPIGQLCPLERNFVATRFLAWAAEIGKTPATVTETERVMVSDLTWIDLQELRCATILSEGETARMVHKNVKEVHPETGEHLAWEYVVHVNAQILVDLRTQRRMILKDWELTPEQKTKKARYEGRNKGNDLSSLQSARADRLRRLGPVIDSQ
jgi:hypothetical protein